MQKKYLNNIYSHKSYPSIQEILLQKKQMKHKLNTIYKTLHTQKKNEKGIRYCYIKLLLFAPQKGRKIFINF